MLKQKIQDRVFDTADEILMAIRKVWSALTFEDLQSVFFDWIQRVEYVIEHEGEYYKGGGRKFVHAPSTSPILIPRRVYWAHSTENDRTIPIIYFVCQKLLHD
jgi:hypothetical protein